MQQLAGGYATVRVEAPGGPVLVHPDHTLLEQALANLIQNAIDATSGSNSRPVSVAVTGRPATITVRGQGPGMTQEQQRRAFDDYYTTKARGMGAPRRPSGYSRTT